MGAVHFAALDDGINKLFMDAVDKGLQDLTLVIAHLTGGRTGILEGPTFDYHRHHADLFQQLAKVGVSHDDPDAAGDRSRVSHDTVSRTGDVITARGRHGTHGSDHFFGADGSADLAVNFLGGPYGTTR